MANTPWRITFDTNPDDCNLACIMCEDHSPYSKTQSNRKACGQPKRRMDIDVIRQVLQELRDSPPREIIPSTMGEPLLYQHFSEILDLCREHGIRLNLTTNGTFPRGGAEYWAQQIVPIGSDVKVSINGATAETQESIMLRSSMAQMLDNIRTFIAVRDAHAAAGGNYCSVTLQATYLETNLDELPEIVRMAARLNADRVKGHHLWDHFDEIKPLSMRRNVDAIRRWNRIVELCRQSAAACPRPDGRQIRLDNLFPLDEASSTDIAPGGNCPFLGEEAWINHEGRFDPCCAPDEQRQSLGSFGKIGESGFLHIWNGPAYSNLREHYMQHELCQRCPMRRPAVSGGHSA